MAKLIKILLILALLAVLLVGIGAWIVKKRASDSLTPEGLVALIETQFDCRAEVGSSEVALVGNPSRIVLTDVLLAPRDEVADAGTPLAERGRMVPEKAVLAVPRLEVSANLRELLKGRFHFQELALTDPVITMTSREEGDSFTDLFETPGIVNGKVNPASISSEDPKAGSQALAESIPEDEDDPLQADALPMPAYLDRASVSGGRIQIVDDEDGEVTIYDEVQLEITEVDINPERLEAQNHMFLRLDTKLIHKNSLETPPTLTLLLSGEGDVIPFDPVTSDWNPTIKADVVLGQGSTLDGHPILLKMGEALAKVGKYGLDLLDLASSATLTEDIRTEIEYRDEVVTLRESVKLPLTRFNLGLDKGGWLDTDDDTHDLVGIVEATPETSEKVFGEVQAYLSDKVGETLGETALTSVAKGISNEAGNLQFSFRSDGDLDDPELDLEILDILGNIIQEVIKDLMKKPEGLGDLLKGLLGGDEEEEDKEDQ